MYIQDHISGRWDGPAIMKFHQWNEVNVTYKHSELSVSNTRVRPYNDKVIESEEEQSTEEEKKVEENLETGNLPNPEAKTPRRSQRIKNAKNVKFAEIEKEEKLFIKEDDSEGIKYLFFMNMMR